MALRLASAGYYGGDPAQVLKARADHVLAAIQYEKMKGEYEDVYMELNKER